MDYYKQDFSHFGIGFLSCGGIIIMEGIINNERIIKGASYSKQILVNV
jgi:hypothetical protein